MRWLYILAVLLSVGTAAAQPVSFQLKGDVPQGQKPQIRITAVTKVTDVRIEVDRDDGKHFTHKHAALAKGGVVTLDIGDGAAGKASYKGTISAQSGGEKWSDELIFETLVRAPMKISYDAQHLDLDKRVLQFKLSRPAGKASLTVIADDGKTLSIRDVAFKKEPANTWLPITWDQPPDARVMSLVLTATSADGIESTVTLTPWSVTVDHEDVNFPSDSAVIEASETKKLDASLAKINDVVKRSSQFVKMRLYIAGHTDTVGANAKNRKLSIERARAIATYFRQKGIEIPIAFEGFGEEVLKVRTADNTDERANRRVDYVIGPLGGSPPFGGAYLKVKAGWKELR
ncbi:MAG: OmpA family protein [Kofleriaceae bacterium]|nr:OmpA family protein [Kofleriaceae bacterium]